MPAHSNIFRVAFAVSTAALLLGCSTSPDGAEAPKIYPALSEPEHKPIFHNDRIDVYQVRLQPGERSYYHLHSRDQLGITMASFESANQVLGQEEQLIRSARGAVSYIPHTVLGGTTHRVRAVTGEMWVIGVEFADPAPAGAAIATMAPGDAAFQFPQGRVDRLALAPGESATVVGELMVAATPGTLKAGAAAEAWTFEGGELKWRNGPAADYTNSGGQKVELLVIDLK